MLTVDSDESTFFSTLNKSLENENLPEGMRKSVRRPTERKAAQKILAESIKKANESEEIK